MILNIVMLVNNTKWLLLILCVNIFFSSVPTAGPVNVQAVAVNSTSIRVTWQPVPKKEQNGNITGYKVQCYSRVFIDVVFFVCRLFRKKKYFKLKILPKFPNPASKSRKNTVKF